MVTVIIKRLVASTDDHQKLLQELEEVLANNCGKWWDYDHDIVDDDEVVAPAPEDLIRMAQESQL